MRRTKWKRIKEGIEKLSNKYLLVFFIYIILVCFGVKTGWWLLESMDIWERWMFFNMIGTMVFGGIAIFYRYYFIEKTINKVYYTAIFLLFIMAFIIILGNLFFALFQALFRTETNEITQFLKYLHLVSALAISIIFVIVHASSTGLLKFLGVPQLLEGDDKNEAGNLLKSIDIPAFVTFAILNIYWKLYLRTDPANSAFIAGAFAFELMAFNCAFALIKSRIFTITSRNTFTSYNLPS